MVSRAKVKRLCHAAGAEDADKLVEVRVFRAGGSIQRLSQRLRVCMCVCVCVCVYVCVLVCACACVCDIGSTHCSGLNMASGSCIRTCAVLIPRCSAYF